MKKMVTIKKEWVGKDGKLRTIIINKEERFIAYSGFAKDFQPPNIEADDSAQDILNSCEDFDWEVDDENY